MMYPKLLEQLRHVGDQALLRKKTHIAYQGEVPRYGYYILDGSVKAYTISADGNETIVDIFSRHSIMPVAWLNRTAPTAIFYYAALTDVRAVRFSRQDFEKILKESPAAQQEYTRYLANAQTALMFRATGLSQSSADHKVSYAFYYLVYRYGVKRSDGTYMVPLKLTHEVIANFIGQSRENTTKTLKVLVDNNVVAQEAKVYTVDMSRLERHLGEDSFRQLVD